jgi:glycolate oxidase iron-sulfur subunit
MQADLAAQFKGNRQAEKAQAILRACVHCGFCAAACPTYQLTGDELDGPRGRIYLIKQMLQTGIVALPTQSHLDRCLTCGACEPACPSGVRYRSLLEIGRSMVEQRVPRSWRDRLARLFMLKVVSHAKRFAAAVKLGRAVGRALPLRIRERLPAASGKMDNRQTNHPRRMLALQGCVQPTAAPQTNNAAARVLDRLGISLVEKPGAGCCGAISLHLAASDQARAHARRNIDAWWPQIEAGAEAIVITASGCGLMVREYAGLLQDDPVYAEKAARVSALTRDLAQVLAAENLDGFAGVGQGLRIAFQCPCTLQHGHGLDGVVEGILRRCGYVTTHVPDSQQCCGSAGTYSILQPEMAERLLERKLTAVMSGQPQLIASANIGCQMHLATRAQLPVKHWIELLSQ